MNREIMDSEQRTRTRSKFVFLIGGLVLLLWLASLGGSWAMPGNAAFLQSGCIYGTIAVGGAQTPGSTIPVPCQPYIVYAEICGYTIPPCTIPPCTIPAAADQNGNFTVCGITPGTYNVVVRGFNTLANKRTGIAVPANGTIPVDFGTLTPGDASGNNVVDILDYSILATAYATCSGGLGWDPRADFNCSGCIEILDYSLLATYYTYTGDACP
ncbi:MAG: hypothetical protein H5T68_03980 [Chloroflexi bacterium]|nr:hypothetical protein [Chloroflexota bacterium]